MIADPQLKIGRPRQLYTGETLRDYVDAHVDHMAIALLPVVEKLERIGDVFERFGGHGPLRGGVSLLT
jgi:hypothetical protein